MSASKYSLAAPVAIIGPNGFATTAGWLTTYNSDTITREYTGARQDYIQVGVGLAAGAYTDTPALPKEDDKAIRRTADGSAWEIVPDYRGHTAYSTESGESQPVTDIGELPATLTFLAPATPYDKWDGSKWVTDKAAQHVAEVAAAEAKKSQLLSESATVISPLQDAVDTDMATDKEKERLTAWKSYRVLLSRVDTDKAPDIVWPDKPE